LNSMDWLNYHHLRYFWAVAKEGSLRKASEKLRVSQPSISAQIQSLRQSVGEDLFRRSGRTLALTEMGRVVFGYADDIFSLGQELLSTVNGRSINRSIRFNVGIADSVPKLVVKEILKPVFSHEPPVHVVCHEGRVEDLLAQLATLRLDIVLADEPASTSLKFKTFNHLLGTCGVSFCAVPGMARKLRKGFPKSLDGAPALLPTHNTNLRRSLEKWFQTIGIRPHTIGEFEDTALMAVVATDGIGFMPIASVVARELERYRLEIIGATEKCTDQFYAISSERRLTHPAVVLITESAQRKVFK
jgi:LysR family transcriptional regulator, transcriptional activator of nhaA